MKLIASDYDGTFSNGSLEDRQRAVANWQAAGNKFGIVSGRCLEELVQIANREGAKCDFLISSGGMRICDGAGSILSEEKCPGEWLSEILPFIFQNGCTWCYIHGDPSFVVNYPNDSVSFVTCVTIEEATKISCFYQISAVCEHEEDAKKLAKALQEQYTSWVNPLQNGATVDIVHAGVDKAQSIRRLLKLWEIEEKNAIVAGDNFNDLPMICAFRSYAMVNAPQSVQDAADYVVSDIVAIINKELNL